MGRGVGGRLGVGMAAQIPIVATTSTPGIARNSKKRPASPFHNGSSAGGYTASKKKKVSASGFAQVRCHTPSLRVAGAESACAGLRGRALGGGAPRVGGAMQSYLLGERRCLVQMKHFFPLVCIRGVWLKNDPRCIVHEENWGGGEVVIALLVETPLPVGVAIRARLGTFLYVSFSQPEVLLSHLRPFCRHLPSACEVQSALINRVEEHKDVSIQMISLILRKVLF